MFPNLIYFSLWNFTLICNVWMLYTIHSSWPFNMMSCMLLFEVGLNVTFSISYLEVHGSGRVIYYPNNMLDIIHSVTHVWCTQNFGRWIWRSWYRASLMYSFKNNQQDATLYNILYSCQCSTCFRQFFSPSLGARKLYTQHLVYVQLACCYY